MNGGDPIPASKTLWTYVREGLGRAHRQRPISFYLLLMIPVVLLLAYNLFVHRQSPARFAFYLSILFIFFFVVLQRAIRDFFRISRESFSAGNAVFRDTIGEPEFTTKLGQRVVENGGITDLPE